MTYKIEYSQIVRRKLTTLNGTLIEEYGSKTAKNVISKITSAVRGLAEFPNKGEDLASLFDVDSDFKYIFVSHNYLFYYIDEDTIYITEMFNEREDFMYQLFDIPSHTTESEEYWSE